MQLGLYVNGVALEEDFVVEKPTYTTWLYVNDKKKNLELRIRKKYKF